MAQQPIILIGFMGSGKSTVGVELAHRLNRSFVDLDSEIAKSANQSIPSIFKAHGEQGFRQREYEALTQNVRDAHIIATGGGIIENQDSLQFLKNVNAQIVWLDAPFDVLFQRVTHDSNRPNAHQKTYADLKDLYLSRYSRYNEIAFIKMNTHQPLSQLLNDLIESLSANDQY